MTSSWKKLSNRHCDEVALVIGNGPSLSDVPVSFLEKHTSFGANRIYLLDEFTPDYYVVVDTGMIEEFNEDIAGVECEKFVKEFYTQYGWPDRYPVYPLYSSIIPSFSRDPEKWVYEGFSVIYVCLQLAFYMGFSTVLLVGVDHNYEDEDKSNYFHPEYSSNFTEWHPPNLQMSENAYHMARTVFEHDGRKIINLTADTKLDVFEKGDWKEW